MADLGPELGTFRWRLSGQLTVLGVLFLAVPAALAAWAIAAPPRWSEVNAGVALGAAVAFGLFPALAILMLRKARRTRGDHVTLHADGLVYLKEGKVHELRWSEVVSLTSDVRQRQAVAAPVMHTHTLRSAHGALVITHGIEAIDVLLSEIRARTLEVMLPRALEQLERGALELGPIEVTRAALHHRDACVLWPDVARCDLDAGFVQLWARGQRRPFARVPLSSVPNQHLLAAIIERLAR